MVIGAGLPDEFAGCRIQRVKVSNDVAEVGGGDAFRTAFTQRDTGSDFSTRSVGPTDTAGFQVKGIDGAVLTAYKHSPHGDRRLGSGAGGCRETKAPLQLKIVDLRPIEAGGFS